MDICNRFEVNGQCALYATGIEDIYTSEEIASVFAVNGEILKIVRIPNEPGQPEGRTLVEYVSDRSISRVDPITLGTLQSPKNPAVVWSVRTIRDICQEEQGKELARRYLEELQAVAGSGRAGFLSVLQNELQKDQDSTNSPPASGTQVPTVENSDSHGGDAPRNDQSEPVESTHLYSPPVADPAISGNMDEPVFNPPQIQRMIVEHVIRNESTAALPSQSRIRTFSGRIPRPNGEVEYDTWRTQVDLLLSDPSLSDAQKVRKILESLLSPAADLVKPLGISSSPSAYVAQVDSAFGVVEDGEELFARFLSSHQNNGENPSAYLSRLHSLLTRVISRGGALPENLNDQLLRQFCRGCWDQSIIIGLQLEHKKGNPPPFPELLLLLRTEEDRRSAKLDRMKRHLGTTKAIAHAHSVLDAASFDLDPSSLLHTEQNDVSKLAKRVDELTKQVEKLSHKQKSILVKDDSPAPKPEQNEPSKLESQITELTKQVEKLAHSGRFPTESDSAMKTDCLAVNSGGMRRLPNIPGMPRAWFCFSCGKDNHIAAHCPNEPNPALVRQKNMELRQRQEKFKAQQSTPTLNL